MFQVAVPHRGGEFLQHALHELAEPCRLPAHLLQGERRNSKNGIVEEKRYERAHRRWLVLDQSLGKPREPTGEREEEQRVDHVEERIGVSELAGHLDGCPGHSLEPGCSRRNPDGGLGEP